MSKIVNARDMLDDARDLIGAILLMAADSEEASGQIHTVAKVAAERIKAASELLGAATTEG